jgi:hypothetical protein
MNVYVEAIEARRNIVRLYDSANKSKNPQDYIHYQSMGNVAVGDWLEQFGNLDTAELNRQLLSH